MNKLISIIMCGLLLLILYGCSESNKASDNELTMLKQQNSVLENENIELKSEVEKLNRQLNNLQKTLDDKPIQMSQVSGISYLGILESEIVRFIDTRTELKALPFDDAPTINIIEPNTLVNVVLKASNGYYDDLKTVWYQVSIPVYDTPSDCYGWVKYNQTKDYTSDNQKLLKDPIGVKIGAICSESYNGSPSFDNKYTLRKVDYDRKGRIIAEQGDFVNIMFAGGQELWVNKNDIIYPEIP